jgi:hypothetical protein
LLPDAVLPSAFKAKSPNSISCNRPNGGGRTHPLPSARPLLDQVTMNGQAPD